MQRLKNFLKRLFAWLTSFPTSLLAGLLGGVLLTLLLQDLNLFVAGVVLGVLLEQLLLGTKTAASHWGRTHPLQRLLGSIASDPDCYIYFSSFRRDLDRPNEFKLLRWDAPLRSSEALLAGPAFVLGEGDAVCLSLILGLLARIGKNPERIFVERAEKHVENWGRSSFVVGAHNPKTMVILTKFQGLPYRFDNNYGVITKTDSPALKYEQTGEDMRLGVYIRQARDSEPTDYGLVLKVKDQFHPLRKTLFVIAGIGPAGTAGAAYYLQANFQQLATSGDEFGILVQVPSGYQSARVVNFDQVASYYIPTIPAPGGPNA